jgi:hypothetical protein
MMENAEPGIGTLQPGRTIVMRPVGSRRRQLLQKENHQRPSGRIGRHGGRRNDDGRGAVASRRRKSRRGRRRGRDSGSAGARC